LPRRLIEYGYVAVTVTSVPGSQVESTVIPSFAGDVSRLVADERTFSFVRLTRSP